MYVNAWLVQANDYGPGDYPAGGPEPLVHDVWRAGGPAIDILAPDIYQTQFAQILQTFSRNGNPAFVPECRQDSNQAWTAFTQLNALCYSPFGIDNLSPDSPYARTYGFINSISGAIAQAQGQKDAIRMVPLTAGQAPGRVDMGNYLFDFTTGSERGGPGRARAGAAAGTPATSTAPDSASTEPATQPRGRGPAGIGGGTTLDFLSAPYLIVIQTEPNEFFFATNSTFTLHVSSKAAGMTAAPASIERGTFQNGLWTRTRRLNGDDIMGAGYDVSVAAARNQPGSQIPIPGRGGTGTTQDAVIRLRLYQYK